MSNKQETPKDVNFPGMEDVDEDELAMLQWQLQIQDKDKTAEAEWIVMSGSIPHLLERILSFLPVSSLKECRLVNTDWNKAAVLQLQKNLPYLVFPNLNNHSFREVMMDNKISPFAKFSICPDQMSFQHVERLFNTIAPSATHLDISNNFSKHARLDPVAMYRIPEFPMLTNLNQKVSLSGFMNLPENGKIERMLRNTAFGILAKSPKLQNLKLEFLYHSGGLPSCNFFKDMLFESLENKNNVNLSYLHLDIPGVTDTHFSRLIAMGLRSRSFSLLKCGSINDVRFRRKNKCSFIDFLRSQSETLVHLDLRLLSGVFDRFCFPVLKKLQTLRILYWKPLWMDFQPTPSINYNEQLPSLNKLEIGYCDDAWVQFLPDASYTPVKTVEVLKIYFHFSEEKVVSENTEMYVLHAAQFFPNLKVLGEIPVNPRIANSIYKWLPRLEELTFVVGFTPSIDEIITGICSERCAELRLLPISEIRKLSLDSVVKNEIHLNEDSLRPMSLLTNLKILRLRPNYGFPRNRQPVVEFSRVSTSLVLTKMSSLETIDLCWGQRRYFHEIDDIIQDLLDSGKSVLRCTF